MRTARLGDVEPLIRIDAAAGTRFADHGYSSLAVAAPMTPEQVRVLLSERQVLVAADRSDEPVGFAVVERLVDADWLCELSVHPDQGRRGIGSALLELVVGSARSRGCGLVGLSTFRRVPFNAPFYARHGFAELALERAPAPFASRFMAEVPPGIAGSERVLMVRKP